MKFNTIPLFKVFGIQINLDYSWFIVFFLITFTLAVGYFPYYYPGYNILVYWIAGAVSAILLFASVLIHELAHSLVALHYKIPVREINLFIFGGVAMIEEEPPSPKVEFRIAIAGPVMSFILGTFFYILVLIYPQDDLLNGILNYMMIVNYIIAFFNLVPAFPLDGGRILRAIIWSRSSSILKATKVSSTTGKFFAYFLIFIGLLSFIEGSFINGIWYILIGLFLLQAAKASYEQTKLSIILSKYKVEHFMRPIKPVLYNETVHDVMTHYVPFFHLKTVPIIGDDGKYYIADVEDILALPREKWHEIPIIQVAKPIEIYVSPYDPLIKAKKLMDNFNLDELPVIYQNTFLGIIKKEPIESLIQEFIIKEMAHEQRR